MATKANPDDDISALLWTYDHAFCLLLLSLGHRIVINTFGVEVIIAFLE